MLKSWMERRGRSAVLMGRMAERLNVDLAAVARVGLGAPLYGIATQCRSCRQSDTCRRWLNGADVAGGYRAFCPNAGAFDAFRHERRRVSGLPETPARRDTR